MFGHFILKQAQMTRGGAMPSGTLESPLSMFEARALEESSMLHQDTKKTGSGNSYVQIRVFIFIQCIPMLPCMIYSLPDLRQW